jgi:fumarate reductase flavoprotein subunit
MQNYLKGETMKTILVILLTLPLILSCAGAPAASGPVSAAPVSAAPAAAQDGLVIEANPGPGPYTGTAGGYHGRVSVTLDVKDKVLVSITAEGPEETIGIGSIALDTLPGAMLQGNTIVVDVVTGATFTSKAIMDAAAKALAQAGLTDAGLSR